MRAVLSFFVVNLGTVVRVLFILTLCLFCWFGMPSVEGTGENVMKLTLTGMIAFIVGGIFCAVSAGVTRITSQSLGASFVVLLAFAIWYLYLVYGSDYAIYFGAWNQVVLPILIVIVSVVVASFGVMAFDDLIDVAFLLNASAVDHIETRLGYFFSRFFECSIQCLLFALTIDTLSSMLAAAS